MKIKFFVFFLTIGLAVSQFSAQEKVETTYLRPSITTFYISPSSSSAKNVVSNLTANNSLEARFDKHTVDFDNLTLDYPAKNKKVYFPAPPKKPDSTATFRERKKYKLAYAAYQAEKVELTKKQKAYKEAEVKREKLLKERSIMVNNYIQSTSKPVVARWFSRDSMGNMNIHLWEERAHYSANDEHVNQSLNSSVSRISTLGEDLMKKSYIVVYDLGDIEPYEDIYNEIDRAKKIKEKYLNIEFKPVKREKEGFRVSYTRYIYKLNFDENVSNAFYEKYWLDESVKTNREEIKNHWETASFPLIKQHVYSGLIEQSQPGFEEYWADVKTSKKRRSKEDLLNSLGNNNLNGSLSSLKEVIEDFQLKTSVFKAYPITAKIGAKEGIKLNHRWFIYEIHLDDEGHQIMKRTGWARTTSIGDNKGVATGKSPTSTFRQAGGKEAYSGMLMQPKPGGAASFNFGYGLASSDQSTAGFVFDMDFRIGNLAKGDFGRGIYVGLATTSNVFRNINTGEIKTIEPIEWDIYDSIPQLDSVSLDTIGYTPDTASYSINANLFDETDSTGSPTTANGISSVIYLSFGREILLGNRGKYFIHPQFGIGIATYKFNTGGVNHLYSTMDSLQIDFPAKDLSSLYTYRTSVRVFSLSMGVHLTPMFSLIFKGSIVNRAQFYNVYNSNNVINTPNTGASSSWGLDKLKGNTTFPIFAGLRINL